MKKLLSIILVLSMIFALAACKGEDKNTEDTLSQNTEVSENEEKETLTEEETDKTEENEEVKKEEKEEVKQEKPVQPNSSQDSKPADKVESKPENKPAQTPAEKPAEKPVQKPAEDKPQEPKTVAYTLVDAFKANASADCLAIAEKLVANPVIKFAGGAMSVEEGYLTGFDNTEIKGFKSGAMFAPMIGTIPFVGYVFELESADKASAFISTLKSNANLRWNICTTADEMVATSVGNKVFFVMSPLSFEE